MEKHILILEDSKYRNDLFKHVYGGKCFIHMFENAWDAIKALQAFEYDIIFLDHDLGGYEMIEEDEVNGTGYDAAKAINETENRGVPVIIHSLNPYGAEKMQGVIGKAAIRIPFGEELFKRVKID